MQTLAWIQNTDFSTWMRESSWALFAALIIHTTSMGFLVGTGFAMDLRILGFAPRVRLSLLPRLFPLMFSALVVAVCSGVLLLIAYPAKAITNPIFYLKLCLIAAALTLTRVLAKRLLHDLRFDIGVTPRWSRSVAVLSLVLWSCGLTAGKFLAYTHTVLLLY